MGSGAAEELPVTWAARTERTDGKTSPEKLAAAAHSACYAMALALRLGERKAVPQRLAITATVTLDEARARAMTFNPDAMDLRPCRRPALLTRRVVEGNKPSGGSHASPRLPRSRPECPGPA